MGDIAIVGGGFCGTMAAVHLARAGLAVTLVERTADPGTGLAYGTSDIRHLLNVRASNMSAFPGQPAHFVNWLAARRHPYGPDAFVPRLIYGEYLRAILQQEKNGGLIGIVQADIAGTTRQDNGFALRGESGKVISARRVILASGNLPPGHATQNPYDPGLWAELAEPGNVLIAGTGLTALDLIVTLADCKREGIIHVMSRSGMFPQVHAPAASYPPMFDGVDLPHSPARLLQAVRGEIRRYAHQFIPWQAVIDGLRHRNQELWQAMGEDGQRRFLHRLRPYWDTHRHRCAPEIMAVKTRLEAEGRLVVHRGTFLSSRIATSGVIATWKPHGQTGTHELHVAGVADCTGPQSDIARLKSGLLKQMFEAGLVSVPANRIGLRTAADYTVIKASGARVEGLYAIGSLLKGRLYESVAVPELRQQAAEVADLMAAVQ